MPLPSYSGWWGQLGTRVGRQHRGARGSLGVPDPTHRGERKAGLAAPTSVCGDRTSAGHNKLVLAEGLVILAPGWVKAGARRCMGLHDNSEFCSNTKRTAPGGVPPPLGSPRPTARSQVLPDQMGDTRLPDECLAAADLLQCIC